MLYSSQMLLAPGGKANFFSSFEVIWTQMFEWITDVEK